MYNFVNLYAYSISLDPCLQFYLANILCYMLCRIRSFIMFNVEDEISV